MYKYRIYLFYTLYADIREKDMIWLNQKRFPNLFLFFICGNKRRLQSMSICDFFFWSFSCEFLPIWQTDSFYFLETPKREKGNLNRKIGLNKCEQCRGLGFWFFLCFFNSVYFSVRMEAAIW